MRRFLHTELVALLERAELNQAALAELTGYTVQQVNNWCRGRSRPPAWVILLLLAARRVSLFALTSEADREPFAWYEVLGVPADADRGTIRKAMAQLGHLHHPDKDGGDTTAMQRITAAYAAASARS